MKHPITGALVITGLLAGCMPPLDAPSAQALARDRLERFCRKGGCGAYRLGHTEKLKDRWLVDFEAPRYRFTVAVQDDGNSKVTVWNRQ